MIDHRPAAIVRCRGAADVMATVAFAAEHGIELSVRGGGHNVAGASVVDGGIVIDTSPMGTVRVDVANQRAHVGPGARLGDVDHEAQAHGLATTGGVDSRTGVAGLTLGGGVGWLARKHGLASDNIVAFDVVTADGRLVRASEREHAELFWALRGGGGNFGIVTNFEFQLHEIGPEVTVAQVFHRHQDAAEVLRFYRDLMADAPDELTCYLMATHLPPGDPIPPELHGAPAIALAACHVGDADEARRTLEEITAFGNPIIANVEAMPYIALQQAFDAGTPDGERYYFKAHMLDELPDGAIDVIAQHLAALPGAYTMVALEPLGGAIGRIPADATAWPHRDARFSFGIFAGWSDPSDDEALISWARRFHEQMAPHATGGVYVNYLDRDDTDASLSPYGDHEQRLAEIKAEWDPGDLFHGNRPITQAQR